MSERMPVVAIVGRPNVGKSTLFNRIVKKRVAIVDFTPGVTRDRNYMNVEHANKRFLLVDTGGFEPPSLSEDDFFESMMEQTQLAIEEATVVIFLTDAQTGLVGSEEEMFRLIKQSKKRVYLCVNKVDVEKHQELAYEFHSLGEQDLLTMSAEHGIGVETLLDQIAKDLPEIEQPEVEEGGIKVAIVGKPNSGKSTLINRLLGEERMIVSDTPGTTRDTIDSDIEFEGNKYLFIDTAGIRKKGRVSQKLEKFSIIMALRAIERADICLLMVDSSEGLTEQDLKIGSYVAEAGKACLVIVNKWDLAKEGGGDQIKAEAMIKKRMKFLSYAPILFLSGLTGLKLKNLFPGIREVYSDYKKSIPTSEFNKVLKDAVTRRPPPSLKGKEVKIFYGTQVKSGPPIFILFVNHKQDFKESYLRYLRNYIRKIYTFHGAPVRLVLRERDH